MRNLILLLLLVITFYVANAGKGRIIPPKKDYYTQDSLLKKQFDDYIQQGDSALLKDYFNKALFFYEDANHIVPSDESAKIRIEIVNYYTSEKNKEKLYVYLIIKGDSLYVLKNYRIARIAYILACKTLLAEEYPQDRIKEIDNISKQN